MGLIEDWRYPKDRIHLNFFVENEDSGIIRFFLIFADFNFCGFLDLRTFFADFLSFADFAFSRIFWGFFRTFPI